MNEKLLENEKKPIPSNSIKPLFSDYDFIHIMITYAMLCLLQISFDIITPVSLALPKSMGGFELSTEAINLIVGGTSIWQLAMSIS